MSNIIMTSPRLKFGVWCSDLHHYATLLWGDPAVSRYIAREGGFTSPQIAERLNLEINNYQQHGIQYWPLFTLDDKFIGCCGLRPRDIKNKTCELGIHLLPKFWGFGFASEAIGAVINYAKEHGYYKLFAGHHPQNIPSKSLLQKFGFIYVFDEYYPPTGLKHPFYEIELRSATD